MRVNNPEDLSQV